MTQRRKSSSNLGTNLETSRQGGDLLVDELPSAPRKRGASNISTNLMAPGEETQGQAGMDELVAVAEQHAVPNWVGDGADPIINHKEFASTSQTEPGENLWMSPSDLHAEWESNLSWLPASSHPLPNDDTSIPGVSDAVPWMAQNTSGLIPI